MATAMDGQALLCGASLTAVRALEPVADLIG